MEKNEAYKIVNNFYNKDNITEDDEFVFIEACNFLIDTENDNKIMLSLGGLYYDKEKYKLAEKYYLMAFNNGNIDAVDGLGYIYYYGRTGQKDYKKAFYYYEIASKAGNLEATMKIADMYNNGYGVNQDKLKYRNILEDLQEKLKDSNKLFEPIPEISHRLAYIYMKENNNEKAYELLIRGYDFIKQRIRYSPFWGNFIICRRIITLLYQIISFDEEDFNFFDLFYVMKNEVNVRLTYNGNQYLISSIKDEDKIIVKCNDKYYKSVEDFLIKATFENKHTYIIDYEDYYNLEII